MSEDDEFDTSQGFDVRTWISLWSYEKFHAAGYGVGIAFLAAIASSAYLLMAYLALLLWALGIRTSPTRVTKTGDRKCADDELENEVEERSDDSRGHGLHAQLLAEIRHKPHYYGMGGLIGDRAGYALHYWWFEHPPTHYEHLPEIVRLLTGGI